MASSMDLLTCVFIINFRYVHIIWQYAIRQDAQKIREITTSCDVMEIGNFFSKGDNAKMSFPTNCYMTSNFHYSTFKHFQL